MSPKQNLPPSALRTPLPTPGAGGLGSGTELSIPPPPPPTIHQSIQNRQTTCDTPHPFWCLRQKGSNRWRNVWKCCAPPPGPVFHFPAPQIVWVSLPVPTRPPPLPPVRARSCSRAPSLPVARSLALANALTPFGQQTIRGASVRTLWTLLSWDRSNVKHCWRWRGRDAQGQKQHVSAEGQLSHSHRLENIPPPPPGAWDTQSPPDNQHVHPNPYAYSALCPPPPSLDPSAHAAGVGAHNRTPVPQRLERMERYYFCAPSARCQSRLGASCPMRAEAPSDSEGSTKGWVAIARWIKAKTAHERWLIQKSVSLTLHRYTGRSSRPTLARRGDPCAARHLTPLALGDPLDPPIVLSVVPIAHKCCGVKRESRGGWGHGWGQRQEPWRGDSAGGLCGWRVRRAGTSAGRSAVDGRADLTCATRYRRGAVRGVQRRTMPERARWRGRGRPSRGKRGR